MPWMMKATATVCLLGVFLLPESATSSAQAGPRAHFPFAYAQYGCAPTDALALDFVFTAEKSECGKYSEPFVKISLWRNLPKSTPYSIEMRATEAGAIRCLKPAGMRGCNFWESASRQVR